MTEAEITNCVQGGTSGKRHALRRLVSDKRVLKTGKGGKQDPFRYILNKDN